MCTGGVRSLIRRRRTMIMLQCCCCLFFFFQAEDGIRDLIVTGVQTCALPICKGKGRARDDDDEPEDEDAGDSRQIKRQRRVTHSSEEDDEVEDERARVSLNSY